MKTFISIYYLLFVCFAVLFACIKSDVAINTSAGESRTSQTLPAVTTVFVPGDSVVITGDTSYGFQTTLLHSGYGGISSPNFPSFTALGPGFGGIDGLDRSLMKFSFDGTTGGSVHNLPPVQKAILYLYQYHRPADQDPYRVIQTGDNSLELHRITGKWTDSTVSWSHQPALAAGSANPSEDVVVIPSLIIPLPRGTYDTPVVDVTAMVNAMIASHNNEGFLLKLSSQGEINSNSGRAFGSFACPIANRRPRLVLYF